MTLSCMHALLPACNAWHACLSHATTVDVCMGISSGFTCQTATYTTCMGGRPWSNTHACHILCSSRWFSWLQRAQMLCIKQSKHFTLNFAVTFHCCGRRECARARRVCKCYRGRGGYTSIYNQLQPTDLQVNQSVHAVNFNAPQHVACLQVYRAICKPLGEAQVAIKVTNLEGTHGNFTAIAKEASLMRRFHHPNLLPLLTSFVSGSELWMVMPYLGAGSVRSIMRKNYPKVTSRACPHAR